MNIHSEPDYYEKRERRLLEQLSSSPETELEGVMSASHPGGSRGGGEDQRSLLFTLEAWRIGKSGPLNPEPLTIRMPNLNRKRLDELNLHLRPTEVVRFRVRLALNSVYESPQALLLEILEPPDTDLALSAVVAELTTTKEFEDQVLGKLVLDRTVDWYEGQANWNGESIKVQLDVTGRDCPGDAAGQAHRLWQNQRNWHEQVLEAAAAELLNVKNEDWLEEGESPLSREEFRARMMLNSISVGLDGRFEFWFDDGDLFFGHSIAVEGNLNGEEWRVSMEG